MILLITVDVRVRVRPWGGGGYKPREAEDPDKSAITNKQSAHNQWLLILIPPWYAVAHYIFTSSDESTNRHDELRRTL